MPLRMSMLFTNHTNIVNKPKNINNLQILNGYSYMNLNELRKSKSCSACSGK